MGTKIDPEWVKKIKADADSTAVNVRALILEVERLEGVIERIGKTIDPHYSPGGDVEWLAQNLMANLKPAPPQAGEGRDE